MFYVVHDSGFLMCIDATIEMFAPVTSEGNSNLFCECQEIFENNRRDITISMMKNHPLLRKFMADKAKIPSLVEIIVHMNLELYSLKRQEQVGIRISYQCNPFDFIDNLVWC